MLKNQGHVLTDDIVINYKNRDRDDCLHFLTHVDPNCKDLALLISPTAKRIYTSIFNAWFLKINFDIKHIDVQGFDINKSYKITYKGNKYIYSFIDSKFTTGSVALLLHGAFGTYLYTGNFCYYPSFLKSPVLIPVIEEKALTRLYLDNTYYEQPSNFFGFDELATKISEIIKSQPMKNFYIYAEKITMDPLLAEIASKLEERVYVCQSTMEIMKMLGYESCFTRHSNESRIFIDKAFIKKRGFGLENIAIYITRFPESCKSFQKIERKGNVISFNFYCHSNHKEICELLRMMKPESMTFLFSEIDKSKLSYDFKFKYDFPGTFLFNGISTKSSIKGEGETNRLVKNMPRQLIQPTILNDKTPGVSKNLDNERTIFSETQDLLILNANNEDKNLVQSTSEKQDATNLPIDYICPLRIRKVPEINNAGLSNELHCNKEDGVNKVIENLTCNKEPSYKSSNKINNSDARIYHKLQPNSSVEFIKLSNCDSGGNTLVSRNIKSLPSSVVQTKTGIPLVFNSRLVKENRLNGKKPQVLQISNIGMIGDGKKNTILLDKRFSNVKKTRLFTVGPNDAQKTKLNYIENGKQRYIVKRSIILKSKTADTNLNMKRSNALLQPHSNTLNLTKLFQGWMDNNAVSRPNNSQTSEKSILESEESISIESHNCDEDSIQLEPVKKTIDEDKNSDAPDSINLQSKNSNQSYAEFLLRSNQTTCNIKNNDNSIVATVENSLIEDKANNGRIFKLINDSGLKLLNKNTEKNDGNGFCKNNCQDNTKDNSSVLKRHLSDEEIGHPRKKLRSDNLRQCLLQSSCEQKEPIPLRSCRVLVKRNSFNRSYFYSPQHDCFFPKFFGFKKHEVKPRSILIAIGHLKRLQT
ncbi:uncharacterized protein [Halyomorpha halys]|uniref:uncharacterized protein n=1 Tax=Halyomorpha halys TaxID=286706 RepID=UPI0006D4F224|nr:uncharacterized protein LOC106677065 isoform X1 [Halyomorpha halys]